MHLWKGLVCPIGLGLFVSCGGGGGPTRVTQQALGLSLSTNAVTVSSYAQAPDLPTAAIDLSISGTIPSTGIFVGGIVTNNGIDSTSSQSVSNNTVAITVNFKSADSLSVGTYYDTITLSATTDQAGTKQIANSPQTVNITYNVLLPPPTFASLSPASACVGGPAFTLTVTGTGFPPDALVLWNGTPVPTTYISATTLNASIPAQAIATAGTALITVSGVDLATSSPVAFPIANSQAVFLDIPAWDIQWDGVNQVIYASILNGASTNPNSIAVIDPASGQIKKTISTDGGTYPPRTGPAVLAMSDDCSFLYAFVYVSQSGVTGVIQRYALPALTLDASCSIPFGIDPINGGYYVRTMQVAPGSPHTIAVTRGVGSEAGGILIFDNAVQRGTALLDTQDSLHNFTSLQWGSDASTLYAADGFAAQGEYAAVNVDANGPALQTDLSGVLIAGGHDIHLVPSTGKIYVGNGQVLDPSSGQTVGSCGAGWNGMVPDPARGLGFFLELNPPHPDGWFGISLHAYDLSNYTALSATTIPTLSLPNGVGFSPSRLVRCGPSVLALGGGGGPICLLTGPFVQGE